MNKVMLIGRLTKDPELKILPGNGTAVTTITLAVDKYNSTTKEREADFIPVTIWGKQAESTATYMTKGSLMAIAGRIQVRSFDDKEGKKRWVTEIVASEVQFLSKSNSNTGNGASSGASTGGFADYDDMEPIDDGSDIPF